jgi:hypothetical protein
MLSRSFAHPTSLYIRSHLAPRSLCPRPVSLAPRRAIASSDDAQPAKMQKLEETLRVKKISEHATLPVRGSDGAAGYDLASAYDFGESYALNARVYG